MSKRPIFFALAGVAGFVLVVGAALHDAALILAKPVQPYLQWFLP